MAERLSLEAHGGATAEFEATYSYPSTARFGVLNSVSGDLPIHIIVDTADPNASADYDDAPLGSLYIWVLAGSVDLLIKTTATVWTAT